MKGSRHCGNVQFTVEGEPAAATSCNCSMCQRKGALMWFVPYEQFRLETPDHHLRSYTFNKHVIRHRFCERCGVHTFCEGVRPDGVSIVAVNVRCLEGIDIDALPVKHFDGRAL